MKDVVRSEASRLMRGRQLLAVWGVMAALMILFTTLIFANAITEAQRA